ncbi:hypothetical protein BDZ90DRAFT_193699 [Jaminaea rosea]|uniref:IPT/TIG domain-containing protein n=1 Tax=Jaminaea rosea TaxID=1569628 RepID=A0A316UNM1_9BASI|nr:hypothetical protein BDZ90DRAFT_193699 [Jaminaea rosea]PWN26860.1 hypothetical protein BDZ90DRAFT_193699 [Jaminaea rosea]
MSALPAQFYHSADDDGAGVIHEDSPPGLTASGSSDDGSSPSSVGQQRGHPSKNGSSTAATSSKAPSEAATAFDAMSPWSSHSSEVLVDSGAHDWASPFSSATEHHFYDGSMSFSNDNDALASSLASSSSMQHQLAFSSPSMASSSSPGIAAPGDAASKNALREASQRMAGGSAERGLGFTSSGSPSSSQARAGMWNSTQKPTSDEQMFDSIIEEDSFGPPSTSTSDYAGSPPPPQSAATTRGLSSVFGAMHMPSNSASPPGLSSYGVVDGIKTEQQDETMAGPQQHEPAKPQPPPASTPQPSKADAADDSIAASAAAPVAGPSSAPMNGEQEVAFSASAVVRPEVDGLADLQIHVHGIAARGAKSRVETQIKAHLELVRPSQGEGAWERIGSFTHLKLPPLSATKRKTKKNQQGTAEIPKEKTLYLDVAVVNASPPHQRAFACQSCSEREKKRADRRKSGRTKSGPIPSEEEMRRLGVDPSSPDAGELAAERLTQEESKRIILFNCGDYLEFKDGHTELPTRVTCYCRHHKEKLGFCILFTMRNWKGKTVACGSTPAIMITDDHKSSAALERSKREAAQVTSAAPTPGHMADRSRGNSADTSVGAGEANGGASRNKPKKSRPKPYDSSRRSTISNGAGGGVAMTPAASNGGANGTMTPANGSGSSPSMDLVTALAAIGNERALLLQQQHHQQQQAAQQQQLPQHQSHHQHQPPQHQQQPVPPHLHHTQMQQPQLNGFPKGAQNSQMGSLPYASMLSQGSISPETLLTNPLSLPGIDFSDPNVAQQMLALLGHQGLVPGLAQQAAPSSSSQHQPNGGTASAPPSLPQARISKIIPGEGPTSGGIEVTILGDNFTDGLTCLFGDLAASSTRVWAANTLICVLPPSPSPGPVAVTLKTVEEMSGGSQTRGASNGGGPLQLFTYVDKSDTQLMELALQVVGFQQTRTMQVPRDIALRLLASGQGSINSNLAQQQQGQYSGGQQQQQLSNARSAVDGLFAAAGERPTSFQDTIINFLSVVEEGQATAQRADAIRLANKNGHTLLHLAVMLGFHRLAAKLLELGCPVDARDRNGFSALHLAALNGRVALTRILLERGARRELGSLTGKVALDFARELDLVDVEDLLVHHGEGGRRSYSAEDSSLFDSDVEDVDGGNVSTTETSFNADEDDELDWSESESDIDSSEDDGDEDKHDADHELSLTDSSADDVTPRPPSTPAVAATQDGPRFLPLTDSSAQEKKVKQQLLPPPASSPFAPNQDKKQSQQLSSAATLRALAEKLPGGLAFLGVAGGLQDRLLPQALQQRVGQTISVFHMQAAEQGTPFNPEEQQAGGSGESLKAKDATTNAGGAASSAGVAGEQDTWRLMSLWRNIVEETGGLWHGRAPPPAYEEAAPNGAGTAQLDEKVAEPAQAAREQQEQAEETVKSGAESNPVTPPATTPRRLSRRSSTSSLDSCSTTASSLLTSPSSSRATASAAPSPANRRRIVVEDDWMLRWFWLPCLVLAFLVAAFSTGPLSLAGLASYVPQLGGVVANAAAAGANEGGAGAVVGVADRV